MSNILTNYRSFLKAFSVVLLAFPYCAYGLADDGRTKPNIVFILADDLGRYQLSSYGSKFYETPNIDRLVKEGVRFTNAYAAAPICSPTRASIMTGKYPARLHLTDFIPGGNPKDKKLITPDWQKHLPLKEVTIAESLKNAGYVTGHFGKWHLNVDKKYKPGRPGDPGSQGFDDVLTTHKPGAGPKSMYDEDWHHVREITERSIAFIQNNKNKPFFCYVTHNSIHSPEIEKKALVEKYATKPEAKTNKRNNPKQAAMLETLDKSVGTILMTLEKLGLEKNTIVFFYSDNGQLGPKNGKPFRGSKGDLYEGGIRMPLIIKWPGVITPGSECGEVVISNDFFPTITAIAGGSSTAKDVDGINFLPLLKDSGAKLTREAVYWHFPHYHSLGLGPQGAVRMGRYKLIEWFERSAYDQANAFELYDLIKDPGEQRNLADTMPEVTAKLKEKLNAWKKRIGAQLMTKRKSQKVEPQR